MLAVWHSDQFELELFFGWGTVLQQDSCLLPSILGSKKWDTHVQICPIVSSRSLNSQQQMVCLFTLTNNCKHIKETRRPIRDSYQFGKANQKHFWREGHMGTVE